MTTFEIIIIGIIYTFCYGFMSAMFIKDENKWFRLFGLVICTVLVVYAPIILGEELFNWLTTKHKNNEL